MVTLLVFASTAQGFLAGGGSECTPPPDGLWESMTRVQIPGSRRLVVGVRSYITLTQEVDNAYSGKSPVSEDVLTRIGGLQDLVAVLRSLTQKGIQLPQHLLSECWLCLTLTPVRCLEQYTVSKLEAWMLSTGNTME